MRIIGNTYLNKEKQFSVKVTTCNSRLATTENTATGEKVLFNRAKFEFMIKRGIFDAVE